MSARRHNRLYSVKLWNCERRLNSLPPMRKTLHPLLFGSLPPYDIICALCVPQSIERAPCWFFWCIREIPPPRPPLAPSYPDQTSTVPVPATPCSSGLRAATALGALPVDDVHHPVLVSCLERRTPQVSVPATHTVYGSSR